MKLAVRIAGSGFVLAAALSSVALARPSDQKCDVSERDARGQCPAKPGTSAKAGKGTRPTAPARSELREHKAPAFAEVDLTAALARPGSSKLRPDPAARNAVPRPDLGVQVDDAMIGEYRRGSDTLPDSDPDKPSYLLKLADAHAARYRQARKAGARSKPAAEAALVRAVKAYSAVTSNQAFARFAKLDEAIGRLAVLLEDSGQQDNALLAYRRLVKEFPRSRYVADAVLALSEQAFYQGKLDEAEAGYAKLAAVTTSPAHAYVRYMTGWVLLNRDRPRDALAAFSEAADEAAKLKQPALVRAARQDSVAAFARFGTAQEAMQRFGATSGAGAPDLLARVADAYLDMGKFDQAIALYDAMIAAQPRSPALCTWSLAAARAGLTLPSLEQRVQRVASFAKLLAHVRKTKLLAPPALTRCETDGEELVRMLAQVFHQEGMKTLNSATLQAAQQLYEVYFGAQFTGAAQASQMRYYYAELLWSRAEHERNARLAGDLWAGAALAFSEAARTPGLGPELVKEATYAAVLAWRKTVEGEPHPRAPEQEDGAPRMRSLSVRTVQMLAAFKAYLAITRAPDEAATISFLAGRIYWSHGHLLEAAKVLGKIVSDWPDAEVAEGAAALLLDALHQSKRHDELVGWVRALRSEPRYAALRARMSEMLDRLYVVSRRKEAEAQEAKGDFAGCAATYLAIASEAPDAEQLDEVLYNAVVCHHRAGADAEATKVLGVLGKIFPKSPLVQRAKEQLSR